MNLGSYMIYKSFGKVFKSIYFEIKAMKYYDKIALGYDELHKEEQLKKIKIIKKHIKSKGLLLDIGAGTGISTKVFEKNCKCIALDPSKEMLKHYKGKKVVGKAESLPFPDNYFDVIISVTSLHLANPEKAIKEIFRVAKPNAQIVLSILKKSEKLLKFKRLLKNFKKINEEKDLILIKHRK